jgi:seryl-tRNA synthetase
MIDPRRLRAEPEAVAVQLARRGFVLDLDRFRALETARKQIQTETEKLQAKAKGEDASPILADMDRMKSQLADNEARLAAVQAEFDDFALGLPNPPHASVPEGRDENDNVEVRRWGTPRPAEGARDHADLGEALGQMDFAAAAKLTGARFTVLRAGLARLHRALIQFMLDVHTGEHGYEELYVPYIVNAASLRGTGQLPKFGEDLFALKGEQDWRLIPTAEVPVTNLLRDEILEPDQVPRRWVCHTPCFRAEATGSGRSNW